MRLAPILIVVALTTAACGDSPTAPSAGTRVEAVVQDSPASTATVMGTLAGNIFASVWDGDRWVDLGSPNGITIPLQIAGRSTTVHGEASVPATSYSRVRLVLQGVTARIARGSSVGGAALTSDVTLGIGGSDQRAELSVPVSTFTVQADAGIRHTIVFELRSQQWLTSAAVQSGRVEDAALQSAITATTRAQNR